jgi:hypothetical protein
MSLVDRNDIPEVETKFSIDVFLLGYGKRDKNTGMAYIDCIFAFAGHSNKIGEQESLFDNSGIASDTFDKSFGFDMGSNRRQTYLRKTFEESKQKPGNSTVVNILRGGGRFSKNRIPEMKTPK